MSDANARAIIEHCLSAAGIRINGDSAWDIQVHDQRFFPRTLKHGILGFGESYMDGWWDCGDLSETTTRILRARADRQFRFKWSFLLAYCKATLSNLQRKSEAPENIRRHYDIGNDLYTHMLGHRMIYSCDNWEHARDLDAAEESKLDFVCTSVGLKPGMRVLDIGCGWGGFAAYAAQKYDVEVLGITLSPKQAELGRKVCADLPVEIRVQDYRDLSEKFDRIVSLGMFEHVGYRNYRTYMKTVDRCLKENGKFYLSTIGSSTSSHCTNPWTDKYIFPNSMLPSMTQIGAAIEGLFAMEELRNWPDFYDKTLMAWWRNFQSSWASIAAKYGERFYRMWKFYLLSSAGCFRARYLQVWQIVLSR
jgi:cyclopropane-fatty-acyl-phospholipid synthase